MVTRLALAWLHLVALAIGPAAVWARARALRRSLRDAEHAREIKHALTADAWWGIAALLWLVTGLWRLLGATEKSTGYYVANVGFRWKMTAFLAIFALELWPMVTLMRWRRGTRSPTPRDAGRIEAISYVQCALVIAMIVAAAGMARGYFVAETDAPATASAVGESSSTAAPTSSTTAGAPVASPAPTSPTSPLSDDDAPPPPEPSGSETATPADLALLANEIAMPLDGVNPATLRSNFDERRGGGARRHEALDLMAPRRTPVKSAAKGRVLKVFTSRAGGLMVYAPVLQAAGSR